MKKVFGLIDALISLEPTAEWGFEEESYENLEWRSPNINKPTKEQVEAEIIRLQLEYDESQRLLAEQEANKEKALKSALEKLARLGLTEEEAKAIAGV